MNTVPDYVSLYTSGSFNSLFIPRGSEIPGTTTIEGVIKARMIDQEIFDRILGHVGIDLNTPPPTGSYQDNSGISGSVVAQILIHGQIMTMWSGERQWTNGYIGLI